jgi:other hect domain ubiquitin protein ligase E3
MGLCIRTGVYLPVNLCSLVWKKIIGEKVNKNDVFMFDEGLSKMGEILFMKSNEITKDLILNSFGESISSISLTDGTQKKLSKEYTCDELFSSSKTRIALFQEIHNIRLNESNSQIISIIKGINKIIPMSVLQYFTWEEMERLVCGKKTVDIELLEKNTIISPELEAKNYLVKWVWEIVKEFSEEERIQFVKFCYAQERLPYSQEEYDQKQIQFTIKFNANFSKDGLPRADTCFFFLILPDYSSKEIMKKMISIAIKMDNVGMNGDKVNNENNRRLDRRMFSRFDDDNYYDDDNL